jgi:hypothetical protein
MATVTNTHLTITSDDKKETSHCVVTCKINFTSYELTEMKEGLRFKLDCKLWGDDSGLNGADNSLFTYSTQFFADASSTATETATFDATLGTSVLNEDFGTDEVYAKAVLTNTYTGQTNSGKSNVISRKF